MENFKQNLPEKQIIAVSASPRKGGNSDAVLESISAGISETGISCRQIQLRDLDFKSCIGCERCRKDKICTGLSDDLTEIYPSFIESQGLVLISPTHNYNVTAMMKAFIDRLYCFYNFENTVPRRWSSQLSGQGRKAAAVGIAEQMNEKDMGFTIPSMKLPLEALGYEFADELAVFGLFDRGRAKDCPDVLDNARKLGGKLADSLKN
ncbi:2-amino-4-deoxychorismate dehydrogenase [Sedimentisphaera cyanobacteriorum]|uniref:2-amino-4-deoxychorismate dehydrogenase n=1 Tax=Sedimentisphaera cyanobacteriorum TaxID=1940790 RepID=A0A1Q2HRH3_9BACT|nr:flavodoxin family protein [Sedimentisphaera cyanobacteriorum]AQQ10022.1 2-amino-4-deoxychorismate dehydrogenase [Sedimentisphaera cyanobacteriorum]